jgi:uncharacterized membrane protein
LKVLPIAWTRLALEDDPNIVRENDLRSLSRPKTADAERSTVGTSEIRQEDSMTRIERSIVIDRPIHQVWDFVQDTGKDALWQTTLVESQVLTEAPKRVGTQVKEVRRFLGMRVDMTFELTEFEPHRRSALKAISGGIPLSGSYELEQVNGATKLTVSGQLDAQRMFKLAEPVFGRMTSRELEASLGHLKDLLEATP